MADRTAEIPRNEGEIINEFEKARSALSAAVDELSQLLESDGISVERLWLAREETLKRLRYFFVVLQAGNPSLPEHPMYAAYVYRSEYKSRACRLARAEGCDLPLSTESGETLDYAATLGWQLLGKSTKKELQKPFKDVKKAFTARREDRQSVFANIT